VQPLVGIGGNCAGACQFQRPAAREPDIGQISRQALPHAQRGDLVQPHLDHVEQRQAKSDDRKDDQLIEEFCHVAPFQRVVERPSPLVQAVLRIGRREDHSQQRSDQEKDLAAHPRAPEGAGHHAQLAPQRKLVGLRHGIRSVSHAARSPSLDIELVLMPKP
jgi:hypothetical protein